MNDKLFTYSLMSQPYLQHCDLNNRLFFSYFCLTDIIVLAEQFFHLKNIIVCSPDIDILYPIYHIFTSLIQPLGSTDTSYVFRFLTQKATPIIFGPISFFLFVYSNSIPISFIKTLVNIKQADITFIRIKRNEGKRRCMNTKERTKRY